MKADDQSVTILSMLADKVFIAALKLERKDEQTAFVERVCAGDDELRHEVDSRFLLHTQVPPNLV